MMKGMLQRAGWTRGLEPAAGSCRSRGLRARRAGHRVRWRKHPDAGTGVPAGRGEKAPSRRLGRAGRAAPCRGRPTHPVAAWVQGAFELAKAGFTLLAERYPDNLRFADVSRSGQQSMMDLQLFAEGQRLRPALSPAADPAGSGCGHHEAGETQPRSRMRPAEPGRAGAAAGKVPTGCPPGAAAPAAAGAEHGATAACPLGG